MIWRFAPVAAAAFIVSGCAVYPYEAAFSDCDSQAGACYRYCEEIPDGPDYAACHADCEAEANQCFATAYDDYRYQGSAYYSAYGYDGYSPWYGRYGYWYPNRGYFLSFSFHDYDKRYGRPHHRRDGHHRRGRDKRRHDKDGDRAGYDDGRSGYDGRGRRGGSRRRGDGQTGADANPDYGDAGRSRNEDGPGQATRTIDENAPPSRRSPELSGGDTSGGSREAEPRRRSQPPPPSQQQSAPPPAAQQPPPAAQRSESRRPRRDPDQSRPMRSQDEVED